MAAKGIATWVKVQTKSGFTSRPISHKYEGGSGYEPGQVITMSEFQKLKAEGNQKREETKGGSKEAIRDSQDLPFFNKKQRPIDKTDISSDPVLARLEKASRQTRDTYEKRLNSVQSSLLKSGVSPLEIEDHPRIRKINAGYVFSGDKNKVEQIKRISSGIGKITAIHRKDLQMTLYSYERNPSLMKADPRLRKLQKEIQDILSTPQNSGF